MPEEIYSTPTETAEQDSQQQAESNQNTPEALPTNYEDLYSTDKAFQEYVNKRITRATNTAVQNALQKQQLITNEQLSEAERLKVMTAEQKADYFEQKYKAAEKARTHDKEIDSLKAQTVTMLSEHNIPDIFLEIFDFGNSTADDITQRIGMLAGYEYYPKGEFDKRLAAALDEKLKQKTPESHTNNTISKPKIPILF